MSRNPQEQLVHFLSDIYSMEQQALVQLESAPQIAGNAAIAADYRKHHRETEEQARLVGERLAANGRGPSFLKDIVMKIGGKSFLLFAKALPETPARLAAHSYSYEAMEWAAYEMLVRFALQAGDEETARMARRIRDEEREMMHRIEKNFEVAEAVSKNDPPPIELADDLRRHLAEAHALESQGLALLNKSERIAGCEDLVRVCGRNREEMRENATFIEGRLKTLQTSPSTTADAAMGLFGLNWGLFFQAQSDTPAKLAAFVYAFLHLKIAGYALLKAFAVRVGDDATARLAALLLERDRAAAERVAATFDAAAEATLESVAE